MKINLRKPAHWFFVTVSVILLFIIVSIYKIASTESQLLDDIDDDSSSVQNQSKSTYGQPSVQYGRADIHLTYLKHSQLMLNETNYSKRPLCIRPYYSVFYNIGDKRHFNTVIPNKQGSRCNKLTSSINLEMINSTDLSYTAADQTHTMGKLLYKPIKNDQQGNAHTRVPILENVYHISFSYRDQTKKFLLSGHQKKLSRNSENTSSISINKCSLDLYFKAVQNTSFIKPREAGCSQISDRLNLHINAVNDADAVEVIDNELHIKFNTSADWHLDGIDFAYEKNNIDNNELVLPCSPIDMTTSKSTQYFKQAVKYGKSAEPLTISCQLGIKEISTETQKLAALYALYGNNKDMVTTLNKSITDKLDKIAQEACGEVCDANIVAMDSTSGDIRSIVHYKSNGAGNILNEDGVLRDTDIDLTITKREIPGSIVKPVFSKAILIDAPEISKLKINTSQGNINWSSTRTKHSGQLLDVDVCRSSNDCRENLDGYSVKSPKSLDNVDFNTFIAKSDNIYAASMMFLANFEWKKSCNENDSSISDENIAKVVKDIYDETQIDTLLKCQLTNSYYFKLPGSRNAIDNKVVPWTAVMNKQMGVRFSAPKMSVENRPFSEYTNYRDYVWTKSQKSLPKAFIINASPEREYLNYSLCFDSGFFACDAYQWIIGGNDSRWSPIAIAEQISAIASNRNVKASFVSHHQNTVVASNKDLTSANQKVFEAMQGVVDHGTAHIIKHDFDILNQQYENNLLIIAKTGTPNKVRVDEKSSGASIAKKIIIAYFKQLDITYDELVSDKQAKLLSDKGKDVLKKIRQTAEYQTQCGGDSGCVDNFETEYENHIRNYLSLTDNNITNDSNSNKRLVFTIGKGNEEGNLINTGCTFYIAVNFVDTNYQHKALEIGKKIISSEVMDGCLGGTPQ